MRLLLVLAFAGICFADNVERIRQNFDERINSKLVQQIGYELQASYLYQAYSHYFNRADVALPGLAEWFEEASKEERSHATTLIDYINKRGGSVSLGDINFNEMCTVISDAVYRIKEFGRSRACICSFMSQKKEKSQTGECSDRNTWKNGLWAMQDVLVLERFVNNELLNIHRDADTDPHLSHILEHEFLDEQVRAIKTAGDYVRQLERVGDGLGEHIFDKHLQERNKI